MRFGILPVQQLASFSETIEEARLAEQLGYDSVWVFEHHGVERDGGGSHYFPSPLIALAAIAAATSRVRLGSGIVILPLLPPVRVAEDALLTQAIAQGRLVLGVGTGYREPEFAAFGVPFAERGARMEEALGLLRRLLAERDVDHHGRFFSLDGVTVVGDPSLPPPPVWVGAWAPAAVRRAARHGDAWLGGLTGDAEKVRSCIEVYRGALPPERAGGAPTLGLERELFVSHDPDALAGARAALHALYLAEHVAWAHPNVPSGTAPGFDTLAAGRFIVGTPDEAAAEIRRYAELGITDLLCRMHYPGVDGEAARSSMSLFAAEVMPRFARPGEQCGG